MSITVLFFVASVCAQAASTVNLRVVLQGRYAAMKAAMGARNGSAIGAVFAPNFVSIDTSGSRENAQQVIADVKSLPQDPHKTSVTTLLSIKQQRNVAIVKQRYDMKSVKTILFSAQPVELITLSTDTWVKLRGQWLMQKTETDQLDYYVNGLRVQHAERH